MIYVTALSNNKVFKLDVLTWTIQEALYEYRDWLNMLSIEPEEVSFAKLYDYDTHEYLGSVFCDGKNWILNPESKERGGIIEMERPIRS